MIGLELKHGLVNVNDAEEGCICGCNPYDPCMYEGCIHCDIPQNKNLPKRKRGIDFSKIKSDGKAFERLEERFKKEHQEYEIKINKLMVEFDNGRLPDTEFINSFLPRVNYKFKQDLIPLTTREKEVIDDMFNKY